MKIKLIEILLVTIIINVLLLGGWFSLSFNGKNTSQKEFYDIITNSNNIAYEKYSVNIYNNEKMNTKSVVDELSKSSYSPVSSIKGGFIYLFHIKNNAVCSLNFEYPEAYDAKEEAEWFKQNFPGAVTDCVVIKMLGNYYLFTSFYENSDLHNCVYVADEPKELEEISSVIDSDNYFYQVINNKLTLMPNELVVIAVLVLEIAIAFLLCKRHVGSDNIEWKKARKSFIIITVGFFFLLFSTIGIAYGFEKNSVNTNALEKRFNKLNTSESLEALCMSLNTKDYNSQAVKYIELLFVSGKYDAKTAYNYYKGETDDMLSDYTFMCSLHDDKNELNKHLLSAMTHFEDEKTASEAISTAISNYAFDSGDYDGAEKMLDELSEKSESDLIKNELIKSKNELKE